MEAMTGLKIRIFGDPVLRRKIKNVLSVTENHRKILSAMAQAMYDASGIGLAAPQVGISQAMIVADAGTGLYKLINPRVVKKEGAQAMEEGCLSIPGVCIKVKRAKNILVEAQDENGDALKIEAQGLLACVLQHEIDHLKGKLIVDYATLIDKVRIKKRLAELKKKADKPEASSLVCKVKL